MAHTTEIETGNGFLDVQITGRVDMTQALDELAAIRRTADGKGFRKVLVDCTGLFGEIRVKERFEYASRVAETLRGLRVAYVLNETLLDPKRFGETVAVNRGTSLKAWNNRAQALGWLGVPEDSD
jgi:hypothetical protein